VSELPSPLDHPDAQAVFKELLASLTAESDRGAILIGAAHVDNCLRDLMDAVFPARMGKKHREALLEYPGPLSSLSGKVQVAYATRLIPRSVYDATNALRKIRNDAAHHPTSFDLADQVERVKQIYAALGATLPSGLRMLSLEMILDYKVHVLLTAAREAKEREPDLAFDMGTREDAIRFIADAPEVMEAMEKQVPRWELAIGIALLCSLIILQRVELADRLGPGSTLAKILKNAGHREAVAESPEHTDGISGGE
jgi:DNA-binding MltR family transcriptional regulator